MKKSLKKGFSFGLTSGVITTLGLIVGLDAGTQSSFVVISGILVIAIADALSDALGIHLSEEIQDGNSKRQVWAATISTLLFKFIFALTFLIPMILLPLKTAVMASIVWGLLLISLLSYYIAKERKIKPHKVIFEHLAIAIIVIILTDLVGMAIASFG